MAVYRFPAISPDPNPLQHYAQGNPAHSETNESKGKVPPSFITDKVFLQELNQICTCVTGVMNIVNLATDMARDVKGYDAELQRREQAIQEQRNLDEELYGESPSEDSYCFVASTESPSLQTIGERTAKKQAEILIAIETLRHNYLKLYKGEK